jgi:2-oxoglutarate dehydrogenase E1 component
MKEPLKSPKTESYKPTLSAEYLNKIGLSINHIPQGFSIHPKLEKLFQERADVFKNSLKLDFAQAELLSFGVCLDQGKSLRLVGQDSARGTFSQRHAILTDQKTEEKYNTLTPLLKNKQFCQIINSPLSEYAVLGFEYGFSKEATHSLNLWEAQFGDFVNGAQIIIDQFIASGKTKWQDVSNLTLLLPHGYEGQGPEHTSARIERFLELASDNNMFICVPTTPAQYFHVLQRQVRSLIPCIVFTPKALLRHPMCKSSVLDIASSDFKPMIDDENYDAKVVVLTFGKIIYDLQSIKKEKKLDHISIITLEQLYPLEWSDLKERLLKRKNLQKIVLVQDEPINMGAYAYLKMRLDTLEIISRKPSSSPATGYYKQHEKEYKDILTKFENL